MVRKKIPIYRLAAFQAEVVNVRGRALSPSRGSLPWDEPWSPVMDVCEKERRIVIKMELPGIDPGDITLLVHHNRLELRGEKRRELHSGPARYHRLERPCGAFRRVVPLPSVILPEKTRATLDNGVLVVILVKAGGGEP